MKRTQAAVSVEVKRVIGALCRLLAALGLDSVPTPEAFRRAKFGGRTEEDQFWQLLFDILLTSGIVSCQTRTQLAADHRKLVAAGLWQIGYHADWMYRRDRGSFSCRDLLLALGWLLAAGTLEKLVTCQVEQLDGSLLSPVPLKPEFSGDVEVDAASLRRLQWLIGRLRHQRRTLLSMIGVRTRLLHDVLSASGSSSGQSCAALQEVCRVQLEVEKPASRPGGPLSRHEAPGELRVSRAVELLLHAETLLLQRRDGRRRANRMLLQESIDCLEELVLIPR
uniref:Chromosome 14 open reading frame 80 n=1 Tax=Nothobranchius pienaari TaxID=704102 RepID=A0A1A8R4V6_9TELE